MTKDIVIAGIVVFVAVAGAATWLIHENRPAVVIEPPVREIVSPPVVAAPAPMAPTTQIAPPPPITNVVPQPSALPARRTAVAPAPAPVRRPNPPAAAPMTVPVARDALAGVGRDPQAEAVWISAINDDNLSPNDRKNLIEDLNETGFADPRNIGPADLPVIEYRLALIEQIGPDAMDDVNYAAFQEAYKDLTNMRARLTGQ